MIPTASFCLRLPVTPGQQFRAASHSERHSTYTTGRRGQKGAVGIIFDIVDFWRPEK